MSSKYEANYSSISTFANHFTAGLAETSECLAKSVDTVSENTAKIDVAFLLANTENQIEKYAAMYKNLQPKEETLTFLPPNFELLQEIRNQGEIVINCRSNGNYQQNSNGSNGTNLAQSLLPSASAMMHRQTPRVANSPNEPLLWDSSTDSSSPGASNATSQVTATKTYASIVKPTAAITGQCIPGSSSHISVKPALAPSKIRVWTNFFVVINESFAFLKGLLFASTVMKMDKFRVLGAFA